MIKMDSWSRLFGAMSLLLLLGCDGNHRGIGPAYAVGYSKTQAEARFENGWYVISPSARLFAYFQARTLPESPVAGQSAPLLVRLGKLTPKDSFRLYARATRIATCFDAMPAPAKGEWTELTPLDPLSSSTPTAVKKWGADGFPMGIEMLDYQPVWFSGDLEFASGPQAVEFKIEPIAVQNCRLAEVVLDGWVLVVRGGKCHRTESNSESS